MLREIHPPFATCERRRQASVKSMKDLYGIVPKEAPKKKKKGMKKLKGSLNKGAKNITKKLSM